MKKKKKTCPAFYVLKDKTQTLLKNSQSFSWSGPGILFPASESWGDHYERLLLKTPTSYVFDERVLWGEKPIIA